MTTYCLYEANNVGPELALRPAVVDIGGDEPERDSTLPCDAAVNNSSNSNSNNNSSSTETPRRTIGFLDLPFEIRLQIYRWLHLLSPVRHAQLAPWYPTPVHSRYVLRRVDAEADGSNGDKFTPTPGLLSAQRPLSGLPTALLRCSSQIYLEARDLPFARNEFVFVNWFASGLWAARAFTRGLEPWQRDALRFVRLEMLARDVAASVSPLQSASSSSSPSSSSGMDEWRAVCADWAGGVRGLRMKMVLGASGTGGGGVMAWGAAAAAAQETERLAEESPREAAEEARRRVREGLGRMRRLERVEMELVTRHLDDGEKVAWCERLQEELRGGVVEDDGEGEEDEEGGLKSVRVVCTEKVREKMEWVSKTVGVKHVQAVAAH